MTGDVVPITDEAALFGIVLGSSWSILVIGHPLLMCVNLLNKAPPSKIAIWMGVPAFAMAIIVTIAKSKKE